MGLDRQARLRVHARIQGGVVSGKPLTAVQRDTLVAINRHMATVGYPPTLREIMVVFGVSSTNAMSDRLLGLLRKGYLRRDGVRSRALLLTSRAEKLLRELGVISDGFRFIAPRRCMGCDCVTFLPSGCGMCPHYSVATERTA